MVPWAGRVRRGGFQFEGVEHQLECDLPPHAIHGTCYRRPWQPVGPAAYRGKPHVGGQGVYTRHLTKALVDLGHHVEVLGGQPYPEVPERVPLVELPSLDIYNDHFPMPHARAVGAQALEGLVEVTAFSAGTFPEPLAFSLRAWDHLRTARTTSTSSTTTSASATACCSSSAMGCPPGHHPPPHHRRPPPRDRARPEPGASAGASGRWYSFTTCRPRWPAACSGSSRCRRTPQGHRRRPQGRPRPHGHRARSGVDPDLFKPLPDVARIPGRLVTTASRRDHEGPEVPARGGGQAPHRARRRPPRRHRQAQAGRRRATTIERSACATTSSSSPACPSERIIELYSEAELAVVPSLYEGFSLPGHRGHGLRAPLVATTGGAVPEVVGTDGETAMLVPPGDSEALAAKIRAASTTPRAARHGRPRRPPAGRALELAPHRRAHRRAVPHAASARSRPHRGGGPLMLTVRLRQLGLQPGDLVLDLGCGAGRHAFETCAAAPASCLRLLDTGELEGGAHGLRRHGDAGEVDSTDGSWPPPPCTATPPLPFADATFDRIIASEVLEHIPDDAAAIAELPGCSSPAAPSPSPCPAWLPERSAGRCRTSTTPPRAEAATCASTPRPSCAGSCGPPGSSPARRHHAHALHSPYWWLRCAVGPTNDDHPLVKAYLKLLDLGHRERPLVTRIADKAAQPGARQEPRRLRPQAEPTSVTGPAPSMPSTCPGSTASSPPTRPGHRRRHRRVAAARG
jgi:SAM-dependent methyltransferase